MKKLFNLLLLVNLLTVSVAAYAVKRGDPLEGQPAVRRRILYLPNRFEVSPSLGVSFLQDYKHSFLIGVKAEYHFNDLFSIGFAAHYSPLSIDSGLTSEIKSTLPNELETDTYINPTPSKSAMTDALDTIRMVMGPYVAYTPAFGKMALFSSVFFNFDLYFFGGLGIVQLESGSLNSSKYVDSPSSAASPHRLHLDIREENGGWKFGPQAGVGLKVFINRSVAINVEFRWLYIKRNAAGFDTNGDTVLGGPTDNQTEWVIVDSKDDIWENTMFFHFGVSFFFPRWAPRSK
ncbi:outer membrane beta-barrel domain-containing protein [Myxococcota bacterium]|nr:outer membrane beta-barrel domain-containing protein [Myxococcota bacterium]MBU1535297.1 outer membrane beta-barrel domain-containing protein [Myxococcota bacterium]